LPGKVQPKLHLFCQSFQLEGNKVSGVAIHPKRIFHPEDSVEHVFFREELKKAAPTGAGKPFGIDHCYLLDDPNRLTKSWYCPDEDGIAFEGLVDNQIAEQIRKKVFKGLSIELNWLRPGGRVEYVEPAGVAPFNFELTSVHFLKRFPPGDPEAYVKLWQSIREQLVVGPPQPLDQRVDALEQRLQDVLNQISVINAKLEVLIGQSSPSATVQPAQPGASQTNGVMKMSEPNQSQEPEKDEHGCIIGKERWDADQEKCVPVVAEQQEPEKDEHGCLIGKERFDEENQKCVPIIAEARIAFLEAKLTLKEQEGQLSVEEIKQKIMDLTKRREELEKKLWPAAPESGLSEEEKTSVRVDIDALYAEIAAYEHALKDIIAAQAVPPEKAKPPEQQIPQDVEIKELKESLVSLRKDLVHAEAKLYSIEKQEEQEVTSSKERYARLVEAVKGAIPPPRIWKSWTPGPQRYVQENLKILHESAS
jgi:hypothetical protein